MKSVLIVLIAILVLCTWASLNGAFVSHVLVYRKGAPALTNHTQGACIAEQPAQDLSEAYPKDIFEPTAPALEEDDRFAFGKVVSAVAGRVTVREYDFAKDSDVEMTYQITETTELGNIDSIEDLAEGDDVVIDYQLKPAGRRAVTLVKEEPPEFSASGVILAVQAGMIVLREEDECKGEVHDLSILVTEDTELRGIRQLDTLTAGDEVLVRYVKKQGVCGAVFLSRRYKPEEEIPVERHTCIISGVEDGTLHLSLQDSDAEETNPCSWQTDSNTVLIGRDSWSDLRKGDRVELLVERGETEDLIIGVVVIEDGSHVSIQEEVRSEF